VVSAVNAAGEGPKSAEVSATPKAVAPPAPPPTSPAPTVIGISYWPTSQQLDVQFSSPMNQSSVATSFTIVPGATYKLSWLNVTHLRVKISSTMSPGANYSLAIGSSAKSLSNQPMAAPFVFGFSVPPAGTSPGGPRPQDILLDVGYWWPFIAIALAGLCIVVGGKLVRTRRRLEALQTTARQLARRMLQDQTPTVQKTTSVRASARAAPTARPTTVGNVHWTIR
jgi:Bacterial Ig-like domain